MTEIIVYKNRNTARIETHHSHTCEIPLLPIILLPPLKKQAAGEDKQCP